MRGNKLFKYIPTFHVPYFSYISVNIKSMEKFNKPQYQH